MSITLARHVALEDVVLERSAGIDGQGMVDYDSPITIRARATREAESIANGTGGQVKIIADVWVDGDVTPLPDQGDRLTLADGLVGIVELRSDAKSLQDGALDHVSLRLRPEG